MYFFLAALGLRCCARAFSSCSERGLLFIVVHGLLIVVASLVAEHGLQARGLQQLWLAGFQQLWLTGFRAQAQQLWCTDLVAPWHGGSSPTRARTRVPCIGRRLLNHCATREAHTIYFRYLLFIICIFSQCVLFPDLLINYPKDIQQRKHSLSLCLAFEHIQGDFI